MNWYFQTLPYLQEEESLGGDISAIYGLKTRFYEAQALRRGIATPRHLELRNATKTLMAFADEFPEVFANAGFSPESKIGDTRTVIELAKVAPRLERCDLEEQLEKFLSSRLSRRQMQAKLALIDVSSVGGDQTFNTRLFQLLASDFSSLVGATSTRWLLDFDQHYFPMHAIGVSFVRSELSIDAFVYAQNEGDLAQLQAKERIGRTPFDRVWAVCPTELDLIRNLDSLAPYGVITQDLYGVLRIYRHPDRRDVQRSHEEELYRSLLAVARRQ